MFIAFVLIGAESLVTIFLIEDAGVTTGREQTSSHVLHRSLELFIFMFSLDALCVLLDVFFVFVQPVLVWLVRFGPAVPFGQSTDLFDAHLALHLDIDVLVPSLCEAFEMHSDRLLLGRILWIGFDLHDVRLEPLSFLVQHVQPLVELKSARSSPLLEDSHLVLHARDIFYPLVVPLREARVVNEHSPVRLINLLDFSIAPLIDGVEAIHVFFQSKWTALFGPQ